MAVGRISFCSPSFKAVCHQSARFGAMNEIGNHQLSRHLKRTLLFQMYLRMIATMSLNHLENVDENQLRLAASSRYFH